MFSDMKPGEWREIPNSQLESVRPTPLPSGNTGIGAVMDAWSGGAYDSKRDRLIVWGGGHSDYAGNEIYTFDVATLKWVRLTDPSSDIGGDESSGVYPDGKPRSRHTYNYVNYIPSLDRFCTFGGAGLYPSGQVGTDRVDCYDFDAKKWENKADALVSGTGSMVAYDPASGQLWMQGAGNADYFTQWNPATNKWTKHTISDQGWVDYYFTGAIGAGKFVAVGDGTVLEWDLSKPDSPPVKLATKGETAIVGASCPGFVYDPVSKNFVAWAGGKDVYLLDLPTLTWKRSALYTGNSVTPTAANHNGTYGRFQYIPSKNAFIAVNETNENVYVFKLNTLPAVTGILPAARLIAPPAQKALRAVNGRLIGVQPLPTEFSGTERTHGTVLGMRLPAGIYFGDATAR